VSRAIKLCLITTIAEHIQISNQNRRISPIDDLRTVGPAGLPIERTKHKSFGWEPCIFPSQNDDFQTMAAISPVLMPGIGADRIVGAGQKDED
jgi:hypothetical protein